MSSNKDTSIPSGVYCDRWPVAPGILIYTAALHDGTTVEIYAPARLAGIIARHTREIFDEADRGPALTVTTSQKAGKPPSSRAHLKLVPTA